MCVITDVITILERDVYNTIVARKPQFPDIRRNGLGTTNLEPRETSASAKIDGDPSNALSVIVIL